jgi:hypothetical protein
MLKCWARMPKWKLEALGRRTFRRRHALARTSWNTGDPMKTRFVVDDSATRVMVMGVQCPFDTSGVKVDAATGRMLAWTRCARACCRV